MRFLKHFLGAALGLAALVLPGCEPELGKVSGKVSYRQQPLTGATVLFYGEGQSVTSCLVAADGSYRAAKLPPGLARVAVVASPPVPPGLVRANRVAPQEARAPQGPAKAIHLVGPAGWAARIPAKYASPDRSGLSLQVVGGEQTLNIDLQPEKSR